MSDTGSRPKPDTLTAAGESPAVCQADHWYRSCTKSADWFLVRHDCPARVFGPWRARLMEKFIGDQPIIHPGAKSGYACNGCRDHFQILFSFGPVHCWGCLRTFATFDDYFPTEVKL